MKNILIFILLVSLPSIAWTDQKYSSLTTMFADGECVVFSWVPDGNKRKKIEYSRKAKRGSDGTYKCEVHIPINEFEKTFEVCFLVGFSNTRENNQKPFGAGFYGGVANGRDDIYWFEWFDAEFTHSDFRCLLK